MVSDTTAPSQQSLHSSQQESNKYLEFGSLVYLENLLVLCS